MFPVGQGPYLVGRGSRTASEAFPRSASRVWSLDLTEAEQRAEPLAKGLPCLLAVDG